MTRDQAVLLIAVAAAVALGVCFSPWSPVAQAAVPAGWTGTTWAPTLPQAPHYSRGGLYHPAVCGEGRTALLRHGWAWISQPPSEETGPGVDSA